MTLMVRLFWLLGCESPEVLADYNLRLEPVLPSNQQDAFDDVETLQVLLRPEDGAETALDLSASDPSVTGIAALTETRLALEGRSGSDVVLWGQSAPISISDGEASLSFVAARPYSAGWLAGFEKGRWGMPVVSLGDGRFFMAGGVQNRSAAGSLQAGDAKEDAYTLDVTAPVVDDNGDISLTEVSSMAEGFYGHTLTVLPDGTVLRIGGSSAVGLSFEGNSVDTAGLYDPTTDTWTELGDILKDDRTEHVAVVRPDGRVAVWGGISASNSGTSASISIVRSLEIYDPNSQDFDRYTYSDYPDLDGLGDLFASAVDLGDWGTLICGGLYFDISQNYAWSISDRCVRISYTADDVTILETAPLPAPLIGFSLTALADGRALLVGGATAEGSHTWDYSSELTDLPTAVSSSAYIFDPAIGSWSDNPVAALTSGARAGHVGLLLPDGDVLIAGGADLFSMYLGSSGTHYTCPEVFDGSRFSTESTCVEGGTSGMASPGLLTAGAADPEFGALVVGGLRASDEASGGVSLFVSPG